MIKYFLHLLVLSTVVFASNPEPSNTFKFGDGTATNKNLIFNRNQGGVNPAIRWNESGQQLEFTNDGSNYSGIGSGSGSGGGGFNLLATNPGFENGVALGWTSTGSQAFLAVSSGSNLLFGKGSATFQTFGGGQMNSTLYSVQGGLQGTSCMASVYYKGGDSTLILEAVDQSNNILGSTPFIASTVTTTLSVPFICPSSGSIQLRVVGSTTSALLALDQMYLGQQTNLAMVSQAQYLGSIVLSNCTGWTSSSPTLAPFSATTGCTYAVTGNIQQPGTQIPGFVLPSVGPGNVMILASGFFGAQGTVGNTIAQYAINDGTSTRNAVYTGVSASGGVTTLDFADGQLIGSFTYANSQTNLTYQIYSAIVAGSNSSVDTNPNLTFDVYYFPSQTQVAYNAATSNWEVDADISSGPTGSGPASGYLQVPGATITARSGSIGVLMPCSGTNAPQAGTCSSGNPEPGVSYNQPIPGLVQVCLQSFVDFNFSSSQSNAYLAAIDFTANADDSVVIKAGSIYSQANTVTGGFSLDDAFPFTFCQNFVVPQAGLTTFRLNSTVPGTSTSWSVGLINITVKPLNQQVPAPVLMNQIVTNNSAVEVINRIAFGGPGSLASPANCLVDPCVIYSQSGNWATSVNRISGGNFVINVAAGVFGSPPTCTDSVITTVSGTPATQCVANTTTAVSCTCAAGGSGYECGLGVICMGPAATP